MLVLAIESSTSSTKSFLYDSEKGILASARESYGALHKNGQTDTEKVFELTMNTAARIAEGTRPDAIALCGTWHGLAALDRNMKPVTATFSWDFLGTAPYTEALRRDPAMTAAIYSRTGCMPHNTYPRHAVSYWRDHGVPVEDCLLITQGAYNFYRLTGEYRETRCTQSGSGLINLREKDYDSFILSLLGIRRDQLAPLCDYTATAPLTEEGAKWLGVPAGIPVVPAHADGALNQLGNYAQRPGVMTLSVGTSAALRLTAEEPILPENHGLWCYLGVDGYISGAAIAGACNCIDWFCQDLMGGRFSFEELEQVKDPENIPVFLPFLFSERCPGWHSARSGGFTELKPGQGAPELYLALQLGILFNLKQCFELLCRENRVPSEILLSGGITRSARWTQLAADVLEMDVKVVDCPDASSMGAVALALYTAGALSDIREFRSDYDKAAPVPACRENFSYCRRQYERYLRAYENGRTE